MIIFNVATYKRDRFLIETLKSVVNQADVVNVMLNSSGKIPLGGDQFKNVVWWPTDNSIGDGYKFYRLEESDGYFFTIDDDLIYPPDYADMMIAGQKKYGGIVTLHGRSFKDFPIKSYYKSYTAAYHCLGRVRVPVRVQFGGTGVMMFHTDNFKFPLSEIKQANMTDIWVGNLAKGKVPITVLPHDHGYLKYQDVGNDTIWDSAHLKDSEQTKLINSIWATTGE
jgi:hypothetical protein